MSNQGKVRGFHAAFGVAIDEDPSSSEVALRMSLIQEEVTELMEELAALKSGYPKVLPDVAKELADVLYVVYGTAVSLGINLDEAFSRVHESNMSKLGEDGRPLLREDGKVRKGPGYREPCMYEGGWVLPEWFKKAYPDDRYDPDAWVYDLPLEPVFERLPTKESTNG